MGNLAASLAGACELHRFGGGRPRKPNRGCADAIYYMLRTNCQWKALDQTELCPGSTAHDRFQEWVKSDVFLELWQASVAQFDELQGIDWVWLSVDSHNQGPVGRRKTSPNPTDRGKDGVKRSPLPEGQVGANRLCGSRRQSE